jgi:chromosomal replication initiator protein
LFPQKQHADMSNNQDRWQRIKERLRFELGEDVFSSWFGRMEFEAVDDGAVRFSVPTRFLRKWIQSHYADRVLAQWQSEEPAIARLELSVRSATMRMPAPKPKLGEAPPRPRESREAMNGHAEPRASVPFMPVHDALGGSPLDPRLSFETFIVGRSNTLAHAAAKQIAESRRGDPLMFNPLYIHAGVGLGKTHLLQAITWAGNSGDRKVLYLTAERFMYGFVSALKSQTTLAFKEALRAADVLVIDDLQFLQGRSTQHEFCHTINALIDAGRQVVIASDRPPADLESLDDRVRSRLAGGLVVEIGSLGEELRLEILKSRIAAARAHHPGFEVPGPVLVFIAKSVTHNGRDLEGAVNRLLAHSKLTGQPVTLEMAERDMRDLIRPAEPKRVRIEDIQRVVARQYNVSRSDLLSSRRTANVVRPRQVAMYLAKILTLRSLPEIGRRFGGRDHTTVLHAVRKIEALTGNDAAFAEEIESLKRQLQE